MNARRAADRYRRNAETPPIVVRPQPEPRLTWLEVFAVGALGASIALPWWLWLLGVA